MRRCAVSILSNIAEERGSGTRKDFAQFLMVAMGSANELETQTEIVRRLSYANDEKLSSILSILNEVKKMLDALIKSLVAN